MKTMTVDDGLYGALEAAADRDGRPVEALVHEAIESWLAKLPHASGEAALDEADRPAIDRARAEVAERGGTEFEAFFDKLAEDRD